ncbi:MAG: hypothetical protein IJ157_13575 [Clostridia bacterium]|nr:hypothetical protein [Clostridia bacterium]
MSLQASVCCKCGKAVSPDEIAITKKLINRGASAFYCVSCLAAYFEVEPKAIRERIAYFRAMGCTLFSSQNESEEAM